jgi:hypothetical protein
MILEWFSVDSIKAGYMVLSDSYIARPAPGQSGKQMNAVEVKTFLLYLRSVSAIRLHLNGL